MKLDCSIYIYKPLFLIHLTLVPSCIERYEENVISNDETKINFDSSGIHSFCDKFPQADIS